MVRSFVGKKAFKLQIAYYIVFCIIKCVGREVFLCPCHQHDARGYNVSAMHRCMSLGMLCTYMTLLDSVVVLRVPIIVGT